MGFFFINDELEVINNENIEFAKLKIEFLAFTGADGVDKIRIKVRDRGVENFKARVFFEKLVADGLNKVGFAEAWAAVEKEGIIAGAWGIDDAFGGGDSKIIIGADDEIIEGIFGIKAVVFGGLVLGGFGAGDFDVFFDGGGFRLGDFAGADFGFNFRLDFEINGFYINIVVFKGGSDDVEIAVAELFDVEGVFDADDNFTVFGRND